MEGHDFEKAFNEMWCQSLDKALFAQGPKGVTNTKSIK